ncbi:MAG: tRNA 4-thiouridine(8) synthase ThiI [Candidatus Pacebacteria bacterium]|nr:tRNA 4-thiouridine(8) synthase ThiI [Candidatus Paceibacterota bacterium]
MLALIHYDEIALKGGNRKFFEQKLAENVKKSLCQKGIVFDSVKRVYGRVLVNFPDDREKETIRAVLKNIFGIAHFSFAQECAKDIEKIKEKSFDVLSRQEFTTFKVETKRGDKNFALTSQQVNEQVGEHILMWLENERSLAPFNKGAKLLSASKVKLDNPDITLYIEIAEKDVFLYTEKIAGPGGLPSGVSGKAICLISGGIDSPVAAWYLMKRGVAAVFVHFYSTQQGYEQSLEKVRDLVRALNAFGLNSKIYFVSFSDIQKEIVLSTQADLRVVLYRRFMFAVASEIAQKEGAKALITGENVGQVASQTLDNMLVISQATSLPILRPLAGFDKIEIIDKAKKIGTYEISIQPHLDCCSMFVPKHPQTKADLKEVRKQEKKLKVKKLIASAIKNAKIETI